MHQENKKYIFLLQKIQSKCFEVMLPAGHQRTTDISNNQPKRPPLNSTPTKQEHPELKSYDQGN